MALPDHLRKACARIADIKLLVAQHLYEGNCKRPEIQLNYQLVPHAEIGGMSWARSHMAEKKLGNSPLISEVEGVIVFNNPMNLVVDRMAPAVPEFESMLHGNGLMYEVERELESGRLVNARYSIHQEVKVTFSVKMREDGHLDVFCRNGGGEWGNRSWVLPLDEANKAWFDDFMAWLWTADYPSKKF